MVISKHKIEKFINLFLLITLVAAVSTCSNTRNKASGDRNVDSETESVFYISPDGNDKNVGSMEQPFASLERASHEFRKVSAKSIILYLREGYYPLSQSFVLDKKNFTHDVSIHISSFPGENAHIIGGKEIRNFKLLDPQSEAYENIDPKFRPNIQLIDLKRNGITEFGALSARGFGRAIQPSGLHLYFDEKPMTLARWPNTQWTKIKDVPDIMEGKGFSYDGDRPSRWLNAPDLWLHGYWKYDWSDNYVKIAEIDTAKKLIVTEPPHSNYPFTEGKRFYALNLLEELDMPGEWYLDRSTGLLYFWPPSDIHGAKAFVSLLQDPLIQVKNLNNITFKNLTFEYTCGAGVEIIGGQNNKIENCLLRNMGTVAISIGELIPNPGSVIYQNTLYNGNAGHNNGVMSCEIYSTGEGGIILGGGDRATLTPGQNYAINNNIYDCSRWVRTYRAGIFMYGVGNIVKNNHIHDLPHTAVFFWGNEHLLEYNEIHHVCMETGDAGAIYNGRDWSQRGSIIRYNYFHHLHGVEGQGGFTDVMAVYMDDWASGTTVFGNIFYKSGRTVMIGGGRDNLVENNIIIDGTPAIHVDARGMGWAKYYFDGSDTTLFKRLNAIQPDKPPYSKRYPKLMNVLNDDPALPKGNRIIRNISSGGKWLELHNDETEPLVYFQDNSIDVDKHFLMDKDDKIQIHYDSNIIPPGFQPIPFDKIGLKKEFVK